MKTKYTNKCQFPNLERFGYIKEMELVNNPYENDSLKLLLENKQEATETEIYIITENVSDDWYEVQLPNGSYNAQFVYTTANDGKEALDIAVDFLVEHDIAFDYCNFIEDNDIIDENGEVIDSICCGNAEIYVPCTTVIRKAEV